MADSEIMRVLGMTHTLSKNSLFLSEPFYSLKAHQWLKENYIPKENEIWIVTYPKTGTTLTLQICHEIMGCYYNKTKSQNHVYYKKNNDTYTNAEWITPMRTKGVQEFNRFLETTKNTTRFFKTHCKLEHLPCKTLPKKMIICCRNPKDALISFYHHTLNSTDKDYIDFKSSFDTYFTLWVAGLVENNSYFEFYKSYWKFYRQNQLRKQTEIYWLNYENLVISDSSKRNEIQKLVTFIGADDVVNANKDIDNIMKGTAIIKMKQQYNNMSVKNFVRKGGISDWKNYFSPEQNEIMDALIKVYFKGTDFKYYKDLINCKKYLMISKL